MSVTYFKEQVVEFLIHLGYMHYLVDQKLTNSNTINISCITEFIRDQLHFT